jgi:hypothetical protein
VLQKDISEKARLPKQKVPKIKHFSTHYSQEDYILQHSRQKSSTTETIK